LDGRPTIEKENPGWEAGALIQINRPSLAKSRASKAGSHAAQLLSSASLELGFLGTRGGIEMRTRRHRRHSALLLRCGQARIMVDCGADWRGRVARLAPSAIVLTHGHPDHAFGLADGVPCPVYATKETWRLIERYPVARRRVVSVGEPFSVSGVRFEAFAVEHSMRAPAVGYRITAGFLSIFYVPDVVAIRHRARALDGVSLYIGDGASLLRPIVRRKNGRRIGHAPIRTQLAWCAAEGVRRAIFTHCGSGIVGGDARRIDAQLRRLARERGLTARIAYDGLRITLSAAAARRNADRSAGGGRKAAKAKVEAGRGGHAR
jgi:phosphoribosyl 1,2-cyclic phosphodiesterase